MATLDVALHGNLIIDSLHLIESFSIGSSNKSKRHECSLGGIANLARSITRIDSDLSVGINALVGSEFANRVSLLNDIPIESLGLLYSSSGKPTSSACIIMEEDTGRKTSLVNWGACTELSSLSEVDAKWHHIAYIDTLPEVVSNEPPAKGITSIDMCLGKHTNIEKEKIRDFCKKIDYIIISDDEAGSFYPKKSEALIEFGSIAKRGCVIHYPTGSISYDKKSDRITRLVVDLFGYKEAVNVLGAGDHFASAFICRMLKKNDMAAACEFAHKSTTRYIEEN